MVEIRSFYSDWHKVTIEQAYRFYRTWAAGATAIPDYNKVEYFNRVFIRGGMITE